MQTAIDLLAALAEPTRLAAVPAPVGWRVTPMLKFELRGVEVKLHGVRQDSPPKMISIDYEIIVDTDEEDRRLGLLHTNVRKFGTISNTVVEATRSHLSWIFTER